MKPDEALARALALSGVALPRGVLGPETEALADALSGDGEGDVAELADAAAVVHWRTLRAPMAHAISRAAREAEGQDAEAFEIVLDWAYDPDPDNPLARALAVRAAMEFQAARSRAREFMRHAEEQLVEDDMRSAALTTAAAGQMAAVLLDLDPEDFAGEIATYLAADGAEGALDILARETGDSEIRAWARRAVAGIVEPEAPVVMAALAQITAGEPPADPAQDLVWVPAMLSLAEEAAERALVDESAEMARNGFGHPQTPGADDDDPGADDDIDWEPDPGR
ncbi:MAG: hypothetical protein RIB67_07080 [Miltoncostaeaceae bacterium]